MDLNERQSYASEFVTSVSAQNLGLTRLRSWMVTGTDQVTTSWTSVLVSV